MAATIPQEVKHWLAQPLAVWHCGMVPQSGMESWQGQLVVPSLVIGAVMVHDLVIAMLTTGANAIVKATRKARTMRNWGMMETLRS